VGVLRSQESQRPLECLLPHTTNLDFATLAAGDWAERENGPVPADFDNREPAAVAGPAAVALYFSSNRADGWSVWRREVTPANEGPEAAVTTGEETQRAALPAGARRRDVRLFLAVERPPAPTRARSTRNPDL